MKTAFQKIVVLVPSLVVAVAATAAGADQIDQHERPAPPARSQLRVLAATEPRHARVVHDGDKAIEKETVAFLGVETSPVSETLSAQLGLARGSGMVVNSVVAKSPAEGVLQKHDILLKLDDQILIEPRQLSVLIRSRKEGDEVTLTYLRGGKQATAKVKLATREVPKLTAGGRTFTFPDGDGDSGVRFEYFVPADGRVDFLAPAPFGEGQREHVDRLLSLIPRGRDGSAPRIQIERKGPGFRATRINPANSSLVYSDDEGSLELTTKDGVKTLVAKNVSGDRLFSGPVTTPEERQAMPSAVRERLEKLEGMQNITFRTDGDFKGAEVKAIRPQGRSISLPPAPPPGAPPRPFF